MLFPLTRIFPLGKQYSPSANQSESLSYAQSNSKPFMIVGSTDASCSQLVYIPVATAAIGLLSVLHRKLESGWRESCFSFPRERLLHHLQL
jgi:hypothetical protein